MDSKMQIPDHLAGLAWPRSQLPDHTLDDNLPPRVPSGPCAPLPPIADLGTLDALPLELLEMVVTQLDLRTLRYVRQVNRRASEVVGSLPSFKTITRHFPNALPAIALIKTEAHITLRGLHEKLCADRCELCGDFGGYLYLLTFRRVCLSCICTGSTFRPVLRSTACFIFRLGVDVVDELPYMKNLRGAYGPFKKDIQLSNVHLDYETCLSEYISQFGAQAAISHSVLGKDRGAIERVLARMENRQLKPSGQRENPGYASLYHPDRMMTIIRAPWFDKRRHEAEWGFHCVKCETARPAPHYSNYRRLYTEELLAEHLESCGRDEDEALCAGL